jgi:hypothetical protein
MRLRYGFFFEVARIEQGVDFPVYHGEHNLRLGGDGILGRFARKMCQAGSHYALAFPMIRVLVPVADRLLAPGPLRVSRGQEQDGSEALEMIFEKTARRRGWYGLRL